MRPIPFSATMTNSAASSTPVTPATPPTSSEHRLMNAPPATRTSQLNHPLSLPHLTPVVTLTFLSAPHVTHLTLSHAGAQKFSPPSAGSPKHSPTAVSSFACNEKRFANNASACEP